VNPQHTDTDKILELLRTNLDLSPSAKIDEGTKLKDIELQYRPDMVLIDKNA